ncbi:GTPase IMAP family member 7 [Kryptolebias marmoratus]|uniref:GTPase IMAP family member 7-like n=1 Tax=Kryptolebias marmoratus TaxID=37003 RepID=A0A3Q3EU32_KRYMA|nr:GTPase IMAP family member 7 [Kryptolebias marmoratus]
MADSNETRVVLLGKTGVGKSSLGNTILGDSLLKTKVSPKSETSECQAESKTVNGIPTKVIDTPGFFDTNINEEKLKSEIINCVKQWAPGPHAFLIVLKVDRYSEQEQDIISKILKYFSEEALKYAVVVFTYGDQLPEGMKIEDFVNQDEALKNLVKKCGGRCHVIDNKYWNNDQHNDYRSNRFQVTQLLNTIETMKKTQGFYSNEFLKQAETDKSGKFWHIVAGATVGALLGAAFGLVTVLGIDAARAVGIALATGAGIGGVAGAVIGGAIRYTSETPQEAVTESAKTVCKVGTTAVEISNLTNSTLKKKQ